MLRIELRNKEGKKVVHEQGFISGRRVRVALEMQDEFDRNLDMPQTEQLDKMVEFVADTFDDKDVTVDTILDGIESRKLMDTLSGVIDMVMGREKNGPKEVTDQK